MPELVANGPTIPVRLMNELDDDRVVFFCGAGISVGPGSELPDFAKLVEHVYEANHMEPDPVEREALDCEEENPERRRPSFDKALGLLERQERLGAQALRRTIIERLSAPPTGPLSVHRDLITLSRTEQGVRLITTNFDNRFVEAGLDARLVDVSPKLPVPKPHNWSSLVHLHGRILPLDDGSDLVLTAADFGRAYLTERWAARFVTELFREFTVVFVGYSVGDPVMSYMVDALAAERAKGAQFASAYAFADQDGTDLGNQKARDGWLAKNVEPILYDRRDEHRLLGETLNEWARIRTDRFRTRSQIALNEITKLPAAPSDPVVERVTWALQDPVAAKALADAPAVRDEEDFTKIETWLDMFAQKGLLSCVGIDAIPGAAGQDPALVTLVDNGLRSRNPPNLDMTRRQLARWIARHVHVPQILSWVLRNGGHPHPDLRQQTHATLGAHDSDIPSRLRLLWTILLDDEPQDRLRFLWTSKQYEVADSEFERHLIEDEAVESIAPRLVVRHGPDSRLIFQQYGDGTPESITLVDACGHLELVSGDEDTLHQFETILEGSDVLSRHAWTLTRYLDQALALGEVENNIYDDSSLYRPSIAAHDQNSDHYGWTHLIDLARDSYFVLATESLARGDNLLQGWVLSDRPLFKRLALHALTENAKSDIHLARKLLVYGRKPGVWEWELRREVLRFFRLAGTRLPRSLRAEIVRAIHAGPKKKQIDDSEIIRREKALRLRKLAVSGARLDRKSKALAAQIGPDAEGVPEDRDEFTIWHGKAGWVAEEDFAPKDLLEGSVDDVAAAFESGSIGESQLRGFVLKQPVKSASALRRLATGGIWPSTCWQRFLWTFDGTRERSKRNFRLQEYVARVLVAAPDELFASVGNAAGGLVNDLAEGYETDREQELWTLWIKAWGGIGGSQPETSDLNDPLTDALNHAAGKLAEAALLRLWKYEPRTGEGFPPPVRPYFDAIASDPDGQLGRVMLASRLYYLFAIDRNWAVEHMIPRLRPQDSEEAGNLWSAYAWSPTVGPDFLAAIKESFFEVLRDDEEAGRRSRNLTSLFMTICLEAPHELTAQEIHSVVGSISENSLKSVLSSLKNRLRGEPAERAQIWHTRVLPWLQEYWPAAAVRNTARTSEAMLDMLAECGDAFMDAADWSLNFLRPVEGHSLYRLGENGHAEQHPDRMLSILERVVDAAVLPVYQRAPLHGILDVLTAANPDLTADPRFQRLYRIATQ